jgi:YVTN family beta-propeller protein
VGITPTGIALNPNNGFLYVTNFNGDNASVIDGKTNTVVETIVAGALPSDIAFSPTTGFMYVANLNSATVSVIPPLTTTFSSGCNGAIGSAGQTATCTVTNTYGRPA